MAVFARFAQVCAPRVIRGEAAEEAYAVLVSSQREACATLLISCWMTRQVVAQITNEDEWDSLLKSQFQLKQEALGTEDQDREEVKPVVEHSQKASTIVT